MSGPAPDLRGRPSKSKLVHNFPARPAAAVRPPTRGRKNAWTTAFVFAGEFIGEHAQVDALLLDH